MAFAHHTPFPQQGHDDSLRKGEGIDIFFLCFLWLHSHCLSCSCSLVSVLIIKGTAPCEGKWAILPETGACVKGELFLSDESWVSTFHESEEVGQESSKGFTCRKKVFCAGLVDFIWNVHKGAMECFFCHPPPEECTDEAVNLLVGDCKPRHGPFSRQVTVDLQ